MNKWRTLSLVYNKGIFKVYDNCQIIFDLNNYPTINALCGNEPVQMSLGNVPMDLISQYGYRYFKGKIDDLQIYMRALSEREVKLYANIECIEKALVYKLQ
ncbi:MAG: LamG-like jellyroll fold domain-containing protein [Segetibacter sp.]